jgi:hypothetical protein
VLALLLALAVGACDFSVDSRSKAHSTRQKKRKMSMLQARCKTGLCNIQNYTVLRKEMFPTKMSFLDSHIQAEQAARS